MIPVPPMPSRIRPTRDEWAMGLAWVTATRGTCGRRKVGAILLDGRGHVLSTGYNGPAAGLPHCGVEKEDDRCPGLGLPSGSGLDLCHAIHAEQNALLQCPNVYLIETCVVTVSPCITCTKLLLNTSCTRIVFADPYSHDSLAQDLWTKAGRCWIHLHAPH